MKEIGPRINTDIVVRYLGLERVLASKMPDGCTFGQFEIELAWKSENALQREEIRAIRKAFHAKGYNNRKRIWLKKILQEDLTYLVKRRDIRTLIRKLEKKRSLGQAGGIQENFVDFFDIGDLSVDERKVLCIGLLEGLMRGKRSSSKDLYSFVHYMYKNLSNKPPVFPYVNCIDMLYLAISLLVFPTKDGEIAWKSNDDPNRNRDPVYMVTKSFNRISLAAFVLFPLLESICKRKSPKVIDHTGKVKSRLPITCGLKRDYHIGSRINSLEDQLLLMQSFVSFRLRRVLSRINQNYNLYHLLYERRCGLLHGQWLDGYFDAFSLLFLIFAIYLYE